MAASLDLKIQPTYFRIALLLAALIAVLFGGCHPLRAATPVTGNLYQITGDSATNIVVKFTPTNKVEVISGGLSVGPTVTVSPDTNGIFTTNLLTSRYMVTIGTRLPFYINVPESTNTQNIVDLLDTGTITFFYSNNVAIYGTKASSNDTTSGFLAEKLVPGTGISFTTNNPGGNETLTISTSVTTNGLASTNFVLTTVTETGQSLTNFTTNAIATASNALQLAKQPASANLTNWSNLDTNFFRSANGVGSNALFLGTNTFTGYVVLYSNAPPFSLSGPQQAWLFYNGTNVMLSTNGQTYNPIGSGSGGGAGSFLPVQIGTNSLGQIYVIPGALFTNTALYNPTINDGTVASPLTFYFSGFTDGRLIGTYNDGTGVSLRIQAMTTNQLEFIRTNWNAYTTNQFLSLVLSQAGNFSTNATGGAIITGGASIGGVITNATWIITTNSAGTRLVTNTITGIGFSFLTNGGFTISGSLNSAIHTNSGYFTNGGAADIFGIFKARAGIISTNGDNFFNQLNFGSDVSNRCLIDFDVTSATAAGVHLTNDLARADGNSILRLDVTGDGINTATNPLLTAVYGFGSLATNGAVSIAATGWTNTFGKNATVYFDGTITTYVVKNNLGTVVYSNATASANATVHLQPNGAVVITGSGVTGAAAPW